MLTLPEISENFYHRLPETLHRLPIQIAWKLHTLPDYIAWKFNFRYNVWAFSLKYHKNYSQNSKHLLILKLNKGIIQCNKWTNKPGLVAE